MDALFESGKKIKRFFLYFRLNANSLDMDGIHHDQSFPTFPIQMYANYCLAFSCAVKARSVIQSSNRA